jgi:hypothetical protein
MRFILSGSQNTFSRAGESVAMSDILCLARRAIGDSMENGMSVDGSSPHIATLFLKKKNLKFRAHKYLEHSFPFHPQRQRESWVIYPRKELESKAEILLAWRSRLCPTNSFLLPRIILVRDNPTDLT